MKSLVIFSGGQDSATCLFWALKQYQSVEAITFMYGQKHSVEVQQSKFLCEYAGVRQTIVDVSFLGDIVDSAMTSNGDVNVLNEKGLPASFVPNRNQLFITLAHAYAQKIGAERLVTGVCQTDYSGYPDCRKEFIIAIEMASNIGSESNIRIDTPMMYLTKAETFKLAKELECLSAIIEHSHTCYEGNRSKKHEWGFGCGECPACKLREKGWNEYKQL